MIASEKLIEDTSNETARITLPEHAAAVKNTSDRMGKDIKTMTADQKKKWRTTYMEDYSAYGEQAEPMADQTINLVEKFQNAMPD